MREGIKSLMCKICMQLQAFSSRRNDTIQMGRPSRVHWQIILRWKIHGHSDQSEVLSLVVHPNSISICPADKARPPTLESCLSWAPRLRAVALSDFHLHPNRTARSGV